MNMRGFAGLVMTMFFFPLPPNIVKNKRLSLILHIPFHQKQLFFYNFWGLFLKTTMKDKKKYLWPFPITITVQITSTSPLKTRDALLFVNKTQTISNKFGDSCLNLQMNCIIELNAIYC